MNITETAKKSKDFLKENEKDIFLALFIVLIGFFSFGLGRWSGILKNKTPVVLQNVINADTGIEDVNNNDFIQDATSKNAASATLIGASKEKNFVASKNGTKYYFVWCASSDKIKQENKIYFASKEEAEKRGYEPAKNCKGL